ncbi:MAG TPA: DUF2339 domain-containing protein, partial [Enhygromyxa sp.]|nr:DUF2339 domain-containing protein [Enhygromyxa sp.]
RFALATVASTLLTLAAWPLARRGHEPVAGAIGGAGLGGWFAAWLVARHVHELVSIPSTFVALAAGAAACLLIADRLRLRLMANLATVAACATPVLVASGSRLHELMIYQLLVIVGLLILDGRRRWPELPTIGMFATWLLAGSWAERYSQTQSSGALLAWSAVLLAVSAASAWRVFVAEADRSEQAHVHARLLIAGISTWAAAAAGFGVDSTVFALTTALLAAWHLGLAVLLHRRADQASELFLGFGCLQLFVFGPAMLDGAMIAVWWIAMSVTATAVSWTGLRRLRGALSLLPAIAAIGWSIAADQSWSLPLGLLSAAALLGASLWPHRDDPHERPIPWLAIIGTIGWAVVVLALGPASMVAQLGWCLIPIAAMLSWACARPTRQAQVVATLHLGLGLLGATAAVADSEALLLREAGDAGERLGIAVLLLVLAGLGVAAIVRARTHDRSSITATGLLTASAVGLALLLGVALIADGSASLGQLGYSLVGASVGLGLIVAGLRLDDGVWRQAGLAALALAAAKVLLFDLAAAPVGWRALSFVGLGAISIAGSFAYSRAYRRACQSG